MWGFSSCVYISVCINFYDFIVYGIFCWFYMNKYMGLNVRVYIIIIIILNVCYVCVVVCDCVFIILGRKED